MAPSLHRGATCPLAFSQVNHCDGLVGAHTLTGTSFQFMQCDSLQPPISDGLLLGRTQPRNDRTTPAEAADARPVDHAAHDNTHKFRMVTGSAPVPHRPRRSSSRSRPDGGPLVATESQQPHAQQMLWVTKQRAKQPQVSDSEVMIVCERCERLSGASTSEPLHDQGCYCDPATRWPGFDVGFHTELCGTCAAATVRSGSRWSNLLCSTCIDTAIELNTTAGFALVPLTRHTLSHASDRRAAMALRPGIASITAPPVWS
jgi:hypothetical protein